MKSSASAPSRTTWIRFETLFFLSERRVNSSSLGLSSTSRISTGSPVMGGTPQGEIECRAFVHFCFCPDAAAMPVNDALHNRETDSCSFIVLGAMEPLEDSKEFPHVLHVEPDSVVFYDIHRLATVRLGAYFDARLFSRARELQGVGEEVGKDLLQERWVRLAHREIINRDVNRPALTVALQVRDDLLHQVGRMHWLPVHGLTAEACEGEKIVDQMAHLLGVFTDQAQVALRFVRKQWREIFDHQSREAVHGPQRGAEIMRDRVAE